jgi:hypothetical protein
MFAVVDMYRSYHVRLHNLYFVCSFDHIEYHMQNSNTLLIITIDQMLSFRQDVDLRLK